MGNPSETASSETADYAKLCDEMDDAVEKVLAIASEDNAEDIPAESPATAPKDEGKPGNASKPEDKAAFAPDNAMMERAIRAGLSTEDAKAIPNKEMFDRICTSLEGKAAKPTDQDGNNNVSTGDDTSADLDIPQLPSDQGFDETLVKQFNEMGKMLKAARTEIAALKKAGASSEAVNWFDKQVGGLDSTLRKSLDDGAKAKLKTKFDMLEAGYKATNAEISREDVFKEAVSLALGDRVAKARAIDKAAALDRRNSMALAMPGGEAGMHGTGKSEDDAMKEVASLVHDKFGI